METYLNHAVWYAHQRHVYSNGRIQFESHIRNRSRSLELGRNPFRIKCSRCFVLLLKFFFNLFSCEEQKKRNKIIIHANWKSMLWKCLVKWSQINYVLVVSCSVKWINGFFCILVRMLLTTDLFAGNCFSPHSSF